ncbi:hypothetical protein ADUPG1_009005 [Aduncisulcus paluster]|uniref:Uncharacterized protein n=1 Tax=Aduncisulcus paluster TaxID=2918883 RepID=A0ABQ5KY11_9EUKA|nr:hypothetical protein ADUPG1_009005 [Aduncisulcus paluster]
MSNPSFLPTPYQPLDSSEILREVPEPIVKKDLHKTAKYIREGCRKDRKAVEQKLVEIQAALEWARPISQQSLTMSRFLDIRSVIKEREEDIFHNLVKVVVEKVFSNRDCKKRIMEASEIKYSLYSHILKEEAERYVLKTLPFLEFDSTDIKKMEISSVISYCRQTKKITNALRHAKQNESKKRRSSAQLTRTQSDEITTTNSSTTRTTSSAVESHCEREEESVSEGDNSSGTSEDSLVL